MFVFFHPYLTNCYIVYYFSATGVYLVYSGVIILEKIFAFFVEFSQIYKSSIGFLVFTFIFDHHGLIWEILPNRVIMSQFECGRWCVQRN